MSALSTPPCHVAVPVHNEEARLGALIDSLASQTHPVSGVTLLLNNCTDDSESVARRLAAQHSALSLRVENVILPPERANVGCARRMAMDLAYERADGRGLILTTDADTVWAPDFVQGMQTEIARGADAVGGRVQLHPADRCALSRGVRRLFLLDIGYRRMTERLADYIDPEPADPYPRHHQHFGAAMGVTAEWYARVGGLPTHPSNEDVAFYQAIREAGGRFRHSLRARAFTSARRDGRAPQGMADALSEWDDQADSGVTPTVPDAASLERRLRLRADVRRAWIRRNPDRVSCIASQVSRSCGVVADVLNESPSASAAAARAERLLFDALPVTVAPIDEVLEGLRDRLDALQRPTASHRPLPALYLTFQPSARAA